MKTFLDKTASNAASLGVLLLVSAMAGLGIASVAVLTLFGLAAFGLAALTAPLLGVAGIDPVAAEREEMGGQAPLG